MSYHVARPEARGSRRSRRPVVHFARESNTVAALLVAALTALAWLACRPAAPGNGDSAVGPPSGGTLSITLAWDAPATDALGRPLEDLASFRIYFGPRSPLDVARDTFVDVGLVTTYTLEGLTPGAYFFATTALDQNGNESGLSGEVGAELSLP